MGDKCTATFINGGDTLRYSIKLNLSRIRVIPKRNLLVLVVFGWLCMWMIAALLMPAEQILAKSHIEEVPVDCESIYVVDTHEVRGSRYKLVLETDDAFYFAWYPEGTYQKYKEILETCISNQEVVTLTMRISDDVSLWDKLLNRITVYDVRDENGVYYSLDDYIEDYERERFQASFAAPLVIGAWLLCLIYILFRYKILVFGRR